MNEIERKTRENGYYWAKSQVGGAFIVRVVDDQVSECCSEDYWHLDRFEETYTFVAGPLKPPEKL